MNRMIVVILALASLATAADQPAPARALTLSIKGLGSPMAGTGSLSGSLSFKQKLKQKMLLSSSLYGGIEAVESEEYVEQFGANLNLALFFGGESGERFTGFLNAAGFRNIKKGIDNQEDLIAGGGVAIIGKSYETYRLKYSLGMGGKSVRKISEDDSLHSRENAPIMDNRLKLKLPFFKKGTHAYTFKQAARAVMALDQPEDYQLHFESVLKLKFTSEYALSINYKVAYDNLSTKDLWTDNYAIGFKGTVKF